MKFSNTLVVLFAAVALAAPVIDEASSENAVYNLFEKRRSCSGHRLPYEVCQGNNLGRQNSFHNWYAGKAFQAFRRKWLTDIASQLQSRRSLLRSKQEP